MCCFIFVTSYFLMLWCFLIFFFSLPINVCVLLFGVVYGCNVNLCFVLLLCCDCDTLWDPVENEMVHLKGLILINK